MNTANLATIFGMTFLGGDQTSTISSQQDAQRLTDTHLHVKVVQTVLENYRLIFEPDE
jgi:hypothetical protein